MLETLLGVPGFLLDTMKESAVIGWNLTGSLRDWVIDINRLRIVDFTRRRFPKCYEQLDGGDKRVMRAFLEPEFVSNTVSLLVGRYSLSRASEFWLSPHKVFLLARDAQGTQATDDSSFVESQPNAYHGAERWFFINGIVTSRDLARKNAEALKALLKRDFILVHNPTQGLVHDLVESALQKFTNINTEPAARAFVEIAAALLDRNVKRVAVVAHSQGTIVMGDVLDLIYCSFDTKYFDRTNMNDRDLAEFITISHGTLKASEVVDMMEKLRRAGEGVIEKLELYMFANAASRMCYLNPDRKLPHIESYANDHDIVAHLGSLARDEFHREDLIRIDGSLFTCDRYGHLLNAHYLPLFARGEYELQARDHEECIGRSIHNEVRGNPCRKHRLHVEGPPESRLLSYVTPPVPPAPLAGAGNGAARTPLGPTPPPLS